MFRYTAKYLKDDSILNKVQESDQDNLDPFAPLAAKRFKMFAPEEIKESSEVSSDEEWRVVEVIPATNDEPEKKRLKQTYEVIKEDISQELADQAAQEQARKDAAARLKARADNAPVTPADLQDLLVHLGLK